MKCDFVLVPAVTGENQVNKSVYNRRLNIIGVYTSINRCSTCFSFYGRKLSSLNTAILVIYLTGDVFKKQSYIIRRRLPSPETTTGSGIEHT